MPEEKKRNKDRITWTNRLISESRVPAEQNKNATE